MKAADKNQNLGDAPIQSDMHDQMNALAGALDELLNGDDGGTDRKFGFILMVFPFGTNANPQGGRCNYISNARREDIIVLLKEQIARFEGMPDITGRA